MFWKKFFSAAIALVLFSPPIFAQSPDPKSKESAVAPVPANLYVEEFFMSPEDRLKNETFDVNGFVFVKTPSPAHKTNYSVVTNFHKGILKTQLIPGLQTTKDIEAWVNKSLKTATFEGVEVRRLSVPPILPGKKKKIYWVGQKSFANSDDAKSQVALVKSIVQTQGGNFEEMVKQAKEYIPAPEAPPPVEIKSLAQFEKEEKVFLRWIDQMDIGSSLYGPFQGSVAGEPILWQSFGETSWRKTNLADSDYSQQVGYWTNRLVFKGIRFPINTLNPYIENTVALETNSEDYSSNMVFFGGVEWRPLERNAWLYNFRPVGGFPLLMFARNYRLFVEYGNRKPIKGEIVNSKNYDLRAGVSIFYEFGDEIPALAEQKPTQFSDYIRNYVWGEYFGNYRYEKTGFSSEVKPDNFIFNSKITLGIKTPGLPLPQNPINDELVLMPYMYFEHVNSTEFSFIYQNRYFVGAGLRWMPFMNYRWKEDEWLSKVKIFGEFVGVGGVKGAKQGDDATKPIQYDLRFGINISSRRF